MPLQSIEHFLILEKDLEETMAFCRDVLGLQVGERPPFPFPGCRMYLESIPCVHIAGAAATEGQSAYLGENRSQSNGTGPIDQEKWQVGWTSFGQRNVSQCHTSESGSFL